MGGWKDDVLRSLSSIYLGRAGLTWENVGMHGEKVGR